MGIYIFEKRGSEVLARHDLDTLMMNLYDNPGYYELAFYFRNMKREVDVFDECFRESWF